MTSESSSASSSEYDSSSSSSSSSSESSTDEIAELLDKKMHIPPVVEKKGSGEDEPNEWFPFDGMMSAVRNVFFSKNKDKFKMSANVLYTPIDSTPPRIALTTTTTTETNSRDSMRDKSPFKPTRWDEATVVMEFMLHQLGNKTNCSAHIDELFKSESYKFEMEPCCFEQRSTILVDDERAVEEEMRRREEDARAKRRPTKKPNSSVRRAIRKATRKSETVVRRGEGYRLHVGFMHGRFRQFYTISIWENVFGERPTFPESRRGNFDVPHPDEGFVPHPEYFKSWFQTVISYCIVWSPTIGKMLERNVETATFHHHLMRIVEESDEAVTGKSSSSPPSSPRPSSSENVLPRPNAKRVNPTRKTRKSSSEEETSDSSELSFMNEEEEEGSY